MQLTEQLFFNNCLHTNYAGADKQYLAHFHLNNVSICIFKIVNY